MPQRLRARLRPTSHTDLRRTTNRATVEIPAPVAVPPARPWYKKKHVIGNTLAILGIGSASACGSAPAKVVATPIPAVTVTAPGPVVDRRRSRTRRHQDGQGPGPVVIMTKTVKVQAAAPVAAFALHGHGTFEVGVDIKAGTYISAAPGSNCWWARLRSSDSVDGIIANNNSSGKSMVIIKASDKFFETNGCSDWTKR
jgi:hypothetical protein